MPPVSDVRSQLHGASTGVSSRNLSTAGSASNFVASASEFHASVNTNSSATPLAHYQTLKHGRSHLDSEDDEDDGNLSGQETKYLHINSGTNRLGRMPSQKRQTLAQSVMSPKKVPTQLNAYGVPKPSLSSSAMNADSTNNLTSSAAYNVASAQASTTRNSSTTLNGGASRPEITDRIRVCVRKRPLNKKELKKGETDIATVNGRSSIVIYEPKVKVDLTRYVESHEFTFDEAFDSNASNEEVYKRTASPLVEYTFQGGKATCFAYGQTGSGKTHTMLNNKDGLYVMAARDIFGLLKKPEYTHLRAWVSFYEIYQGQLYDLLNSRKKLFAREDGKQQVCIRGMKEYEVSHVDRLMEIFDHGSSERSTGSTGANSDSSRSHAIFQIVMKHNDKKGTIQGFLKYGV